MKTKFVKIVKETQNTSHWSYGCKDAIFEVSVNTEDGCYVIKETDDSELYRFLNTDNCVDVLESPMTPSLFTVEKGYESLHGVLMETLDQAQNGKGKERHASAGVSFDDQPIMVISDMVGDGYPIGQAIKKLVESQRLNTDAAITERLGAMNYIAASILKLQKGQKL